MSEEVKYKVLCLLHYYRHLNDTDFNDLSVTNLIIHKVQVELDVKLTFNVHQKR